MKLKLTVIAILAVIPSLVIAKGGTGTVRLGYVFTDDEGNQSAAYRAYNDYEGGALSFENFRLDLENGLRLTGNARNLTLNNRNVSIGLNQTKKFGVTLSNSSYRRNYSFEGDVATRRRSTGGTVYIIPHALVRIYGGMQVVSRKGSTVPLFDVEPFELHPIKQVDAKVSFYHFGVRAADRGASINAEVRGNSFVNNLDATKDRTRSGFRIDAQFPVPKYEWLVLTGGFRRYASKFKSTDFEFWANTGWGGAVASLTEKLAFRGTVVINRATSDSDLVSTDNIVYSGYLTYTEPKKASFTFGYQAGANDNFETEVKSNVLYMAGWYAASKIEFRGDVGLRAEEVNDGSRMIGDEDRNRYRGRLTWKMADRGKLQVFAESRTRENSEVQTQSDVTRFGIDGSLKISGDWSVSFAASSGKGTFENGEAPFETFAFTDKLVSGDMTLPEYRRLIFSGGLVYYRSGEDIDIESVSMRATADLQLGDLYHLVARYDGHNYDDLKHMNMYYTANTVELTIAREVTF